MAGYAAIGSHDVWYARVKVDDPIARVCGETLARSHARAGGSVPIAAYLGKSDVFHHGLTQLGEAYADPNERDHAAMRAAGDSGRSVTETGI